MTEKQHKIILHPTYFPSSISFAEMARNKVIWEVQDNYQKQTYRNRTYIATDRGKHLLSIPILHVGNSNGRQLYKEVRLDHNTPWQRQHWRTLETAYRTSPFFEYYEDELKPLFETKEQSLLQFNFKVLRTLCDLIQIEFPEDTTQSYQKELPNPKTDRRFLVNAKQHLKIDAPNYVQVFGDRHGFLPNLGILDVLFNEGPGTLAYLEQVHLST